MYRRGSKNDTGEKEDQEDSENNGYIKIFVKPLEQGSFGYLLKLLGVNKRNFSTQQLGVCYCAAAVTSTVLLYQLLRCDVGILFQRLCYLLVPMFSIMCAFYWLSFCFRRTWSQTSVYLLFCSCYLGEFFAQIFFRDWWGENNVSSSSVSSPGLGQPNPSDHHDGGELKVLPNHTTQPLVIVFVLFSISIASVFSSLETAHSAGVILLVSFARFLSCSMLQDVPNGLRPFIAYSCAFAGNVVAKYMETVVKPQILQNVASPEGKIPVIKRRRSSTSTAAHHSFAAHRAARRTSLPALIQKTQVGRC